MSAKPHWIGGPLVVTFLMSFPALFWWKALEMQEEGEIITRYGAPVSPYMLWLLAALFAGIGFWAIIKVFKSGKIQNKGEAFLVSVFIALFCFGSGSAVAVGAQAQSEFIEEAGQ